MLKVEVLNKEGRNVGSVELDPKIFDVKMKQEVVHRAVVAQLSKKNVTAKSKDRGEVRGGGIKPWKQKGTGRARVGSIRSPLWKGGGRTFGPVANKNSAKKINKREKRSALHMVLTDKVKEKSIIVVDNLKVGKISTKNFAKILKNLKASEKSLIVLKEKDEKILKSARNLANSKPLIVSLLNIYDVIRYDSLVIEKEALGLIK